MVFLLHGDVVRSSIVFHFFFQAEDGIRDLVRSRGLGDVYKRQRKNVLLSLDVKERLGPNATTPVFGEACVTWSRLNEVSLHLSLIHI